MGFPGPAAPSPKPSVPELSPGLPRIRVKVLNLFARAPVLFISLLRLFPKQSARVKGHQAAVGKAAGGAPGESRRPPRRREPRVQRRYLGLSQVRYQNPPKTATQLRL